MRHYSMLPFSLSITLFIITSILLPRKASCVDYRYLTCNPKTCGDADDGPIISFPFYIQGEQESYCGYPGFSLSCNNGRPILKLSDSSYIIHQILYEQQSFLVSNAVFANITSTCIPPIQNLSLPDGRFGLSPGQKDLLLFYHCNSTQPLEKKVACFNQNTSVGSTLAMFKDDPLSVNASQTCAYRVVAPVPDMYIGEIGGLESVLKRGFMLNWTASNCSICKSSGGKCGFNESSYLFKCYCPDRAHASDCDSGNNKWGVRIGLGVGVPATMIIFLSFIGWLFLKRKRVSSNVASARSPSDPSSQADLEEGSVYFGVPIFSCKELEEATNNFDSKKELGDGGFGTVYHGKLRDGREVAVKFLYEHNYRRLEHFMNEIKILTLLRHKNLVSLYGCTSHRSRDLLLVYEYIPNGTVADHLHGDQANSSPLSWPLRISIAIETASALAYLHASEIIHRDVKTNNILLDNNFCVKVADFGLSRLFPTDVTHVSTAPQGTPGYVDPEYHQCYQLTDKSDVYSFGVVLIELISSMPAVDISRHRSEINLANLAICKIQKCAFEELIDPCLGYELDEEVKRMTTSVAELAFRCLQQDKEMRPSMDEVLEELKIIASGEYEENEEEKHDDDQNVSQNKLPPPSPPDCDQAALLKNVRLPTSPDSVVDKWIRSSSTTPNASG